MSDAKCTECGLPGDRVHLCDRWDCPALPKCQQLDKVAILVDDGTSLKHMMVSRGLAESIKEMIKEISPGGQYCGKRI